MPNEIDVFSLASGSGAIAQGVLFILALFSMASWAVMLQKAVVLSRSRKADLAFLQHFEPSTISTTLAQKAKKESRSPLARLFVAVFEELERSLDSKDSPFVIQIPVGEEAGKGRFQINIDRLNKHLERHISGVIPLEASRLERFNIVLATTGAITPFIGLFGTVWGIMNSFRHIGMMQSANIAVVAPGISEALVATAAGLAVAIPAVIGYNAINSVIRRHMVEMHSFATRILGKIEVSGLK